MTKKTEPADDDLGFVADDDLGFIEEAPQGDGGVLGTISRALDYDRGALGGPLLDQVLGSASLRGPQFQDRWAGAATPFSGEGFPSSAEIFEAHGVPELGSVEKEYIPLPPLPFGLFDSALATLTGRSVRELLPERITGRDVLGAVTDVATSPSSWITFGTSQPLKKLADRLTALIGGKANEFAFDALRAYKGHTPADAARRQAIGKATLESGALRGVFPDSQKIAKRLGDARSATGDALTQKVMDISNRTPEAVAAWEEAAREVVPNSPPIGPLPGTPKQFGVLKDDIKAAARARRNDTSGVRAGMTPKQEQAFERTADDFLAKFPRFMSLEESEALKRNLNAHAKSGYDKIRAGKSYNLTESEKTAMALADAARQASEDTAEFISKHLGTNDLEEFRRLKSEYGPLDAAYRASTDRMRGDRSNRRFSPSDYGAGIAGSGLGLVLTGSSPWGLLAGAAAGGANRYLRNYGSAQMAKTLNRLSVLPQAAHEAAMLYPFAGQAMRMSPWSVTPGPLMFEEER